MVTESLDSLIRFGMGNEDRNRLKQQIEDYKLLKYSEIDNAPLYINYKWLNSSHQELFNKKLGL